MSLALPGFFRTLGFNVLQLGPAAAYSLRSLDPALDPTVVNVRRSNDNSTSDFTASEVSDGTLTSWVGGGNDGYVTTWHDQGGTNNATQAAAARQPRIVDAGSLVTEGGDAALDFLTEESCLHIAHSDLYGQSTLDSYYVTNPSDSPFLFPSTISSTQNYGMVSQEGSTSANSKTYGSPTFYANGVTIGGTRGDVYDATFGGQRLVAHVGADTSHVDWSNGTMNFGNYVNNSTFGYTGKLQEMIFFNTDQSTNRVAIENNINDHFGIY